MAQDNKDGTTTLNKSIRDQNLKFSVEFDDGGGQIVKEANETENKNETENVQEPIKTEKEQNARKRPVDDQKSDGVKVQKRSNDTDGTKENRNERSEKRSRDYTWKKEKDLVNRPEEKTTPKRNTNVQEVNKVSRERKGARDTNGGGVHLPSIAERNQGGVKQNNGEKGEIPIYARIRGPGPAHYALPSTIGRNNVDTTKRASPAFSFGHRSWSFKSESPGPAYNFDPQLSSRGRDSKPSYSFGVRPKTPVRKNATPGPGAYNTDTSPLWEKRAPHYSMGFRSRQRAVDNSPSPNIYKLPPMIGDKVPNAKGGPAISMSPRREKHGFAEDLAKTPGPAAYGMFSPSLTKVRPPEYTVQGRNFNPGPKNNFPGPGSYSPQNVNSHLEQSPRHVIGVRHSDFKMPTITPADVD